MQNELEFDQNSKRYLSNQYNQQLKDKKLQQNFELENKIIEQTKIKDEASYAKSVTYNCLYSLRSRTSSSRMREQGKRNY